MGKEKERNWDIVDFFAEKVDSFNKKLKFLVPVFDSSINYLLNKSTQWVP